jgi:threonine dehydrogenase-like Zn-dependent dehydrogenase
VLGCGPVGLLAVLAARQRGAAQVGVAEYLHGAGAGETVVVLGCGPVGLLVVLAARRRGAAQVRLYLNSF